MGLLFLKDYLTYTYIIRCQKGTGMTFLYKTQVIASH